MKQRFVVLILMPAVLIASLSIFSGCVKNQKAMPEPPVAEKIEKKLVTHGHERIDPYYWMNQRDDQKVLDYLNAENAYTDAVMAHTKELQKKLYDEMLSRIKQDDESVPYKKDGYYYYSRYEQGKEYPVYCRRKDKMENPEEILLNVNQMAEGHEFFSLGSYDISTDNQLIAYSVDTVSRRLYSIYIKDLATGRVFPEIIANTSGSVAWANDNRTLFYVIKDEETLLPCRVYRHLLGTGPSEDVLAYEEKDPTFSTSCYKTKSKQFIMIGLFSSITTEYRYLDANDPAGEVKILSPRERGMEYYADHYAGHFYIRTNLDAKNFRLMKAPINNPGKESWQDVIPHRDDILLEEFEMFNRYLVISEKKNGLNRLRLMSWDQATDHYLPFEEETYSAWLSVNPDFDSEWLRFGYTSLTTPVSTYDYNMDTHEKILLKRDPVRGDFDPSDYEAKRLYATAPDGASVPISLVYRKGLQLDGRNPAWITGYGSYGSSYDPHFSSVRLSLLDRGFVFAIAHIRGGEEMGYYWYEQGKMLNKKNTFTDFIACVEHLIALNYTDPDHIIINGGSAGGLLMGAVVNMQPDLFKGIIAEVPFVDVVTTMLDESIPLTTGEYDEWGNPNQKQHYDYMLSYSPYDNVGARDYPAMLVTTGYHDSQVQYWEPAKWVARLRDMKTDDNLLVFKINMDYGHGGASGRFKRFEEIALEYAFALEVLK
jgi:oligopeptidase B